MDKLFFIFLILLLSLTFANFNSIGKGSAHNFDTDDNTSFLTLVNKILIESRLLNTSISDTNNSGINDNSDSFEYIENVENILEEFLIPERAFTVDSDQFYNNTIISLVIANLADEVLRNYGHAYGIPSNIMLSMNFSNINNLQNNSTTITNSNMHSSHIPDEENITAKLIDIPSYYIALETTDRMIEIYDEDLKGFSSDSEFVKKAVTDLGDSLFDLRENIEMMTSPSKIMENVHGRVHPNLQIAFNLTLNPFS